METGWHLFRLVTQDPSLSLISNIVNHAGAQIHHVYPQNVSRLLVGKHWSVDLNYPRWLLELPTMETLIERLCNKHEVSIIAEERLALYCLYDRYQGYAHVCTDGSIAKEVATSGCKYFGVTYRINACWLGNLSSLPTSEVVAILLRISFTKCHFRTH